MNDLKDLLERAFSDGHGPDPAQQPEPAGDLARGRSLLRRRRLMGLGLTAAAGGAAAAILVPLGAGTGAAHHGPAAVHRAPTGIALVVYDGKQPPGYTVAEVPRGWVIQGGNAFALVLAPKDDQNTNINVFIGKLVVMLQSQTTPGLGPGTPQPVAGRPGRFDVQDRTEILTYKDAAGATVQIQAPTSLGWDSARLAQFAAGVQVLGNAQQGQG